jgi:CheY-like chemotaxis protein
LELPGGENDVSSGKYYWSMGKKANLWKMARTPKNDPQKPHRLYQPLLSKEGAMTKILCVDDDPSILDLYYEEFLEEGYEVLLARNGQEALEKYQEEVPQLTIMDIRMPGMNGIEALNAILGKNRQAAVIFNTAFPHYRENFMTWGAAAYLIKSSDLSELKQKVREVFAGLQKAAKKPSNEIKVEGTLPAANVGHHYQKLSSGIQKGNQNGTEGRGRRA